MSDNELILEDAKAEASLPDCYYEAYKQRMAGVRVQTICTNFQRGRKAIWSWIKAVEKEFEDSLSGRGVFNCISESLANLKDLEMKARAEIESATSTNQRVNAIAEARKCCTAQNDLLTTVGILPNKSPDSIFREISDMKPGHSDAQETQRKLIRSRDDLLRDTLNALNDLATL